MDYGFIKACACLPDVKVAGVTENAEEIIQCAVEAYQAGAQVILFPELALTGYTCGDLFHQNALMDSVAKGVKRLEEGLPKSAMVVVGLPRMLDGRLYNCAAVFNDGELVVAIPKRYLPNYKEFYEKRWFRSGADLEEVDPTMAKSALFEICDRGEDREQRVLATIGIEICEDLWTAIPPSAELALSGAEILLNLSASNETTGKADYRRSLVQQTSARLIAGYLYASSGPNESTTDLVFSGHRIAAENGVILEESKLFDRERSFTYATFDVQKIRCDRVKTSSFGDQQAEARKSDSRTESVYRLGVCSFDEDLDDQDVLKSPFVPLGSINSSGRARELFAIQVNGLVTRIHACKAKRLVIGVSGGLDSTLALLVCVEAVRQMSWSPTCVLGVTMPGFGTSERTLNNAMGLMNALGIDHKTVDIREACRVHMADIGLDPDDRSVSFENVQARERTQVLMDVANMVGGIVIGTGNLSEAALGWCTYNGDHMSMYSVNCSIPKTLVRCMVRVIAHEYFNDPKTLGHVTSILDTVVSPELLPTTASGEIAQSTEDAIGPYELHDFFLYYVVRWGFSPEKILYLANRAFKDRYSDETLAKWLKTFYGRFFASQFKRSCVPDGPKVGSISLSPRGDWRMPSDASSADWVRCER